MLFLEPFPQEFPMVGGSTTIRIAHGVHDIEESWTLRIPVGYHSRVLGQCQNAGNA